METLHCSFIQLIQVRRNCAEVYEAGFRTSGVYTIDPDDAGAFDVYCDQKTAGGGWTVFQKRLDGSVDFYRGWDDYKRGFGNLNGEFWLGLDKIHRLTKGRNRLWVDLEDFDNQTAYAEYDSFGVGDEQSKYKPERLGQYAGKTQNHSWKFKEIIMKFHAVVRSVQQFTCLYDLWARSVSPRARYHFLGKPFYQKKMSLSIMRM